MSTKFDKLYSKVMEQNLAGGEGSVMGPESSGEYAEGDNRLPQNMGTYSRQGKKKKKRPVRKTRTKENAEETPPKSSYSQDDLIEAIRLESEKNDNIKTAKTIAEHNLNKNPNYYKEKNQ